MLNKETLRQEVLAHKAYRAAQIAAFHDQDVDASTLYVEECASFDRLKRICKALEMPMKVGLKDEGGRPETMYVEFEGCRFWAPVFGGVLHGA